MVDLRELEDTGLVRRADIPAGWPMDEQAIHGLEAIDGGAQPAIDHASVGGSPVDTIEGAFGGRLGAEVVRRHVPLVAENRAMTWLWKAKGRLPASA